MQSHPNYKGYNALTGNPRAKPAKPTKPTMTLSAHIGPITKADLYCEVPANWLQKINAVRKWCEERDIDFCPSPFPYQIAKVMAGDFTIVLWASKEKKTRVKFIKCAFEGPYSSAGEAMTAIKELVA